MKNDMTCDECGDLLSPLLDGGLRAKELELVAAHLSGCAACARECALTVCADAAARLQRVPAEPLHFSRRPAPVSEPPIYERSASRPVFGSGRLCRAGRA